MTKSKITLAKPVGGGGNYVKFTEGDNVIRIVSYIIDGFEAWSRKADQNEVHRQKDSFSDGDYDLLGIDDRKQKQFYACMVWNYTTGKLECMVITQMGIKENIFNLVSDEDWGDPKAYDIVINRSGSGLDTNYSVRAKPHKVFTATDLKDFGYKLENLYDGGDPFTV